MKIKTSDLIPPALDWAVWTAAYEGCCIDIEVWPKTFNCVEQVVLREASTQINPSTDWSQGGPIIEREGITVIRRILHDGTPDWWATAEVSDLRTDYDPIGPSGPTPLIAAMRCFVASKLGEEVEVPDELT